MSEIPVVYVRVVTLTDRSNRGTRLLKFECPWCGATHTHGGGVEGGSPLEHFLGHRVSHCPSYDGGYELALAEPEEVIA